MGGGNLYGKTTENIQYTEVTASNTTQYSEELTTTEDMTVTELIITEALTETTSQSTTQSTAQTTIQPTAQSTTQSTTQSVETTTVHNHSFVYETTYIHHPEE